MLHGSALHGTESRAQRSMTLDERLKRAPQRRLVRFRLYPERGSNVVSHAFRRELLEEPKSLLSMREREHVGSRGFLFKSGLSNLRCGARRLDHLEAARGNLRDALTADEFGH